MLQRHALVTGRTPNVRDAKVSTYQHGRTKHGLALQRAAGIAPMYDCHNRAQGAASHNTHLLKLRDGIHELQCGVTFAQPTVDVGVWLRPRVILLHLELRPNAMCNRSSWCQHDELNWTRVVFAPRQYGTAPSVCAGQRCGVDKRHSPTACCCVLPQVVSEWRWQPHNWQSAKVRQGVFARPVLIALAFTRTHTHTHTHTQKQHTN